MDFRMALHRFSLFKNTIICIFIFLYIHSNVNGQIKGLITAVNGDTLPYATVYIEGTSIGTMSNVNGQYELAIEKNGTYQISFQYVGFKKQTHEIFYQGKTITKNIALQVDGLMDELTIAADREDPAIAIMRKAIQKRSYYKKLIPSFESDLYVKGTVKILDAPQEILGNKIGDMNGILDSSRQGMVYLSESKSKFYFSQPDKVKEVMYHSIKSGDNDLFTANQFSLFSFDLYDEYLQFGRAIVSPLADNALTHYQFQLESTTVDNQAYTINKIKIIPKTKQAPLLNGYIYIIDDLWNLHSVDVRIYGNALKTTFIDTIFLKQVFIPVKRPDQWALLSQIIGFKAGIFGFKMAGTFSYIFSNYILNQDLSHIITNNETFKVDQKALNKDTSFWKAQRPIPLTTEEERDYIKKDSLSRIWNSKSYMDSVDRIENKFKVSNIFLGYTWNNSYKKMRYVYPTPLSLIRFNAVEGTKINYNSKWQWSDSTFRKLTINPVIQYGFADDVLKPHIAINYLFDNYSASSVYLKFGKMYDQFDQKNPMNERNNTWNSLLYKVNSIHFYQNEFVEMGYKSEVCNGLFIHLHTEYTNRNPVTLNSNYSFGNKDKSYKANEPRLDIDLSYYAPNRFNKNIVNILFRPAQKYSSYPHVKIRDLSNWPSLEMEYEVGLALNESSNNYNKWTLRVKDHYVNAHLLGYFRYNVEFGSFLNTSPSFFGDFFHPIGNNLLFPIDPELNAFNLLPFYSRSTNQYYGMFNFRHHFNGYIIDKIPLLNKTSLKAITGLSGFYEPLRGHYLEATIGLENFRIGPIVLFSVDYTWAFDKNGFVDRGFVIKLSQLFDDRD